MKEVAFIGKLITLCIVIIVYVTCWGITTLWLKNETDDLWMKILGICWLSIHAVAFIVFLVWSWMV